MPRPSIDINCDLGEWSHPEPSPDDALFPLISSANVACGFHAGDAAVMAETAARCARDGIAVGAHPSYRDREGFGRRDMDPPADVLLAELAEQLEALAGSGAELKYVKPHGALYNRIGHDDPQADVVARAAAAAGLPLLGQPGTAIHRAAARHGVRFVTEGFLDRAYRDDGSLVPRSQPGALITDPDAAGRRAVRIVLEGVVETITGGEIALRVESLCVHSDTPGALGILQAVHSALQSAGIDRRAF